MNADHRPRRSGLLKALLLLALGLLASPAARCDDIAAEPVRLRIVLVRHGVRSPTKSPRDLGVYSAQAWPEWPVAPGQLTPHGADVMQALGNWYRQRLIADGLIGPGCDAVPALGIVADSTPRNHDSAAALATGLAPGCAGAGYRAFASGQADPLFAGLHEADSKGAASHPIDASAIVPVVTALQQVLLGCTDRECLARARDDGKKPLLDPCLLDEPADRLLAACVTKALKTAGSLAENLLLEQAQGMAAGQVGWGRTDAAGLGRLIELHNRSFGLAEKDDPAEARRHASNLLSHVAATLAARAGTEPAVSTLADPGHRVLFLVGHDTNLASVAGLLGLDWHDARQPDDYPPGGALIFDLIGKPGHERVRVHTAMPTLAALREARFDAPQAVVTHVLSLPGCGDGCTLAEFQSLVGRRVDANEVAAAGLPAPWVAVDGPARH